MESRSNKVPLVSVSLPLAPDADPALLEICLRSLSEQTYRHFEVLILVSDGSPAELLEKAQSFPSSRVFVGSFTKSGARNFLAARAAGEYLLYIGVNSELSPGILEECVAISSENGSLAVISPQRGAKGRSFWAKCRSLEKELLSGNPGAEGPNFLKLSTFRDVGGFEEDLDPLDDWALTSKLRAKGVPFDRVRSPIFIRETTNLVEMLRRKYLRGQMIPALVQKFPDVPHLRFSGRFVDEYLRNWMLLLRSPILTLGLAFLKFLDLTALSLGRLRPMKVHSADGARAYLQPEVASTYDKVRLGDNFNRYKNHAEMSSLLMLLRQSERPVLEVGCGTGRITVELERKGFKIRPLDPSPPMLRQFKLKSPNANPVQASGMALPFMDNSFPTALSLRVIWHLPTMAQVEQNLTEISRVASRTFIVDITNRKRWNHRFVKPLAGVYFAVRPRERTAHKSSRLMTIEGIEHLAESLGFQADRILPLDILSPLWLNLLPSSLAKSIYPALFRFEAAISNFIPPGRYLVKFCRIASQESSISPTVTL